VAIALVTVVVALLVVWQVRRERGEVEPPLSSGHADTVEP
jgi:hypothetical protein